MTNHRPNYLLKLAYNIINSNFWPNSPHCFCEDRMDTGEYHFLVELCEVFKEDFNHYTTSISLMTLHHPNYLLKWAYDIIVTFDPHSPQSFCEDRVDTGEYHFLVELCEVVEEDFQLTSVVQEHDFIFALGVKVVSFVVAEFFNKGEQQPLCAGYLGFIQRTNLQKNQSTQL